MHRARARCRAISVTEWAAQLWAPCSVPKPKPRHWGEKWEERRKWVTLPRKVRSLTKACVWPLQRNPLRIQLRHSGGGGRSKCEVGETDMCPCLARFPWLFPLFPGDLPAHLSDDSMQGHTRVPAHACISHHAHTREVGQGVHRGAGRGRGPGSHTVWVSNTLFSPL